MKLLILSDLHLEFGAPFVPPAAGSFDAVILAGDIHCPGHKAIEWAQQHQALRACPVILVPGNHEFYGHIMDAERQRMREAAEGSNVRLLDRDVVVIGGVRFIGCILWTDFQLAIHQPMASDVTNVERALAEASTYLNDFRRIEVSAAVKSEQGQRISSRLLTPEDTLAMHWVERDWLRRTLAEPFNGPTVVVTHHAPTRASVAQRYASDWLTPAFVSDLPDNFFETPVLWVHGHTHTAFDYERHACRVVSNPRGYPAAGGTFENSDFDAGFIVDVPTP